MEEVYLLHYKIDSKDEKSHLMIMEQPFPF